MLTQTQEHMAIIHIYQQLTVTHYLLYTFSECSMKQYSKLNPNINQGNNQTDLNPGSFLLSGNRTNLLCNLISTKPQNIAAVNPSLSVPLLICMVHLRCALSRASLLDNNKERDVSVRQRAAFATYNI
ncbi:hypothetical protein AMECASPLE_014277 [Ameca splendens]|uniref:Uncharacterized protein n=1 Tax=Ameca splendens TaxID=208324 RepID=A0ABV0ZMG0_9TELE